MSLTKTLRAARLGANHIITPRLKEFLRNNPNLVVDDWVADKIHEQLVKQPRVRSGSFSSSAAGDCPRKQIFQYLGIEPDEPVSPTTQNVFYDGTWRHLRWQAVLLQAGLITEIEYPLTSSAERNASQAASYDTSWLLMMVTLALSSAFTSLMMKFIRFRSAKNLTRNHSDVSDPKLSITRSARRASAGS